MKSLTNKYFSVKGILVAPPVLEGSRLFLYIKKDNEEILVCVTENSKNQHILKNLSVLLPNSNQPIFIFGKRINAQWHEYVEGIDMEIAAVGYYNPSAQKYQTIITTYGLGFTEMINSLGWKNFLQMLSKKALETAL